MASFAPRRIDDHDDPVADAPYHPKSFCSQAALARSSSKTYGVQMSEVRFEWDEIKSRENKRKHRVSFEEAQTVFFDENAIRFFDPDHSQDEDRFIMLGMSFTLRVLVVCHCHREDDLVIRIISARKADKREQSDYWR